MFMSLFHAVLWSDRSISALKGSTVQRHSTRVTGDYFSFNANKIHSRVNEESSESFYPSEPHPGLNKLTDPTVWVRAQ